MTTWLTDDNGNKCSVEYFGSEEAAQKALDSLVECKNCINCSDCSDCADCTVCSRCSDCSDCSGKKGENGDFTPPAIPRIDNIHSAIFKAASQPDALDMSIPHRCGTTHCRAGWAVHLAGDAGYELERHYGWCLAAQMIYEKSGYLISPVRFYETDEQAMADMKRLAEIEASRATGEA